MSTKEELLARLAYLKKTVTAAKQAPPAPLPSPVTQLSVTSHPPVSTKPISSAPTLQQSSSSRPVASSAPPPTRSKTLCRQWPACDYSDSCLFTHPSMPIENLQTDIPNNLIGLSANDQYSHALLIQALLNAFKPTDSATATSSTSSSSLSSSTATFTSAYLTSTSSIISSIPISTVDMGTLVIYTRSQAQLATLTQAQLLGSLGLPSVPVVLSLLQAVTKARDSLQTVDATGDSNSNDSSGDDGSNESSTAACVIEQDGYTATAVPVPRVCSHALFTAIYGGVFCAYRDGSKLILALLQALPTPSLASFEARAGGACVSADVVGGVDRADLLGHRRKLYPINFVRAGLFDPNRNSMQPAVLEPYNPARPPGIFFDLPPHMAGSATTRPPRGYFDAYEVSDAPLGTDAGGHALLERMGWRPGVGLGKRQQGTRDPIPIVVRAERAGLGRREG